MIAARLIEDLKQAEAGYAEGLDQLKTAGAEDQDAGLTYMNSQELALATLKMASAIGVRTRAILEIVTDLDKRISTLEGSGRS